MKDYKYDDFRVGERVYHKSNTRLGMIVIHKDSESHSIFCRWMTKEGERKEDSFLYAELVKADDTDRDRGPTVVSAII